MRKTQTIRVDITVLSSRKCDEDVSNFKVISNDNTSC